MILEEQAPVPLAELPVTEFRAHLKLGTGFSDDAAQDAVLEPILRSALAAIEARTSKIILARSFCWKLVCWRGVLKEELPVAPVNAISELRIIEPDGGVQIVPQDRFRLEQDTHRPAISCLRHGLPTVPVGGGVEVDLEAGMGTSWADVPADIGRAVLLLAAQYHENRHAAGDAMTQMPNGIASLLAPYQVMRLFGGRA